MQKFVFVLAAFLALALLCEAKRPRLRSRAHRIRRQADGGGGDGGSAEAGNVGNVDNVPAEFFDCSGQPDGNYPNEETDCSVYFWSCSNGRTSLRKCGSNDTRYDELSDMCLYPDYVEACGGETTTKITTTTESTTTTQAAPMPEFDCSGLSAGNYPNPDDPCSPYFFSCLEDGTDVATRCPPNTYYDQELNLCGFFADVPECSGTPRPQQEEPEEEEEEEEEGPTEPPPPPPFDCTGLEDGNYADPEMVCSTYFFACSGSIPYTVPCPAGLYYNVEEDACLNEIQVPGCPAYQEEEFCAGRINGFYLDPADCTKFYFCVDQFQFSLNCPEGTVYNDRIKRCVDPTNAPPPCGTGPRAMDPPFTCEGRPNGAYRDPTDCTMFFTCENGVQSIFSCMEGQAFDSAEKICVDAVYVDGCAPATDEFLEDFCIRKGADGIYPFPEDCHASVVCIQDFPFAFFCALSDRPDFDPETLSCVAEVPGCE